MSDARKDDVVGMLDVGWGADPGDGVAAFLDGVDERADVARHVVEEVHCWHCGGRPKEGRGKYPRYEELGGVRTVITSILERHVVCVYDEDRMICFSRFIKVGRVLVNFSD